VSPDRIITLGCFGEQRVKGLRTSSGSLAMLGAINRAFASPPR
jgi:hypothetical protein